MLIAGRYRLQTTIGRGAMGEVWRAYDETLGRAVAVKLLLAQNSDPTASSRFRLEAQTAGRLSHPMWSVSSTSASRRAVCSW